LFVNIPSLAHTGGMTAWKQLAIRQLNASAAVQATLGASLSHPHQSLGALRLRWTVPLTFYSRGQPTPIQAYGVAPLNSFGARPGQ